MNGNVIALDSNPASLITLIIFLIASMWLYTRAHRSHNQILTIITGLLVFMFFVTTVAVAIGGTNGIVLTQGPVQPHLIPTPSG